jgi:FecR protein
MNRRKKSIAISAWMIALAIAAGVCQAQSIGTVTDLQGSLLRKDTAGAIKILALDSPIESGDRLLTRPGSYARMVFTDGTAVTLGPESELGVEQYAYSDTARANSALFDLLRGRVQIATGRLGARSVDRLVLNTLTASIVVGNATFIAGLEESPRTARLHFPSSPSTDRAPPGDAARFENVVYHPLPEGSLRARLLLAQNTPPTPPNGLNPGLYVQVLDGAINLTNGGGTQTFTAGQFGFTPGFQQPPVILPNNPGLQFTPPPAFISTTGSSAGSGGKPGDVDCIVR